MKLVLKIFIFQITYYSHNTLRAETQCLICSTTSYYTQTWKESALGNTNTWLKFTRTAQNISYCVQEKILSSILQTFNELLFSATLLITKRDSRVRLTSLNLDMFAKEAEMSPILHLASAWDLFIFI